ncbi:MAG: glycoside hydrolase family 15 protein, partial [Patescibacteria group bacterium]
MPKAITLGNGSILIGLDKFGQVKDLYFHYPGLENHISEYFVHKIGIFVEEKFSWIDSQSWQVEVKCEKDTMISDVTATNSSLGLELHFTDAVYNEDNIFIREVKVKNQFDRNRKLKIFFNQQFNIS